MSIKLYIFRIQFFCHEFRYLGFFELTQETKLYATPLSSEPSTGLAVAESHCSIFA